MTPYLLSVHMVEDAPIPSQGAMEQAYADVDELNTELKEQGVWVFAGVCNHRTSRPSSGRTRATSW
ncbi:hypothetical protein BH23ACT10_BH23ACT10_14990 [soil metagenome]